MPPSADDQLRHWWRRLIPMPAAQAQAEQEVLEKTMMNGVRLSDKLRCEAGAVRRAESGV